MVLASFQGIEVFFNEENFLESYNFYNWAIVNKIIAIVIYSNANIHIFNIYVLYFANLICPLASNWYYNDKELK